MNRGTARKTNGTGSRLRIGDVARRAGVNAQTLRYYERRGILAVPRRSNAGYREYPTDTPRLIRFIKRAQELGFTLTEIEELIALRRAPGRRRAQVRALATAKIRDVDEKIARLQAIRDALSLLVEDCGCGAETVTCPILEALDDVEDEASDEAR